MFDILELQKKLISVVGISSFESARASLICELAAPHCDEVYIDRMGNVVAHIKGKPSGKKIMMSAHMDTIGLIATFIEQDGRIRFDCLGGISPTSLLYSTIQFENGIYGCVGIDDQKEARLKAEDYPMCDMFVDIGTSSREETLSLISLGDTASYTGTAQQNGDSIISIYLDDLIADAIQLCAMEQISESENDLYFVFSVQEEIGGYGAEAAAKTIQPDIGIAIDVTDSEDTAAHTAPGLCISGNGAAIKLKDSSVISNHQIVNLLREAAQKDLIPYQYEILLGGGTDTRPIQSSRAGVPSCCISIPTRYIHSQSEICRLSDVESCVRLLCSAITSKINLEGPVNQSV